MSLELIGLLHIYEGIAPPEVKAAIKVVLQWLNHRRYEREREAREKLAELKEC